MKLLFFCRVLRLAVVCLVLAAGGLWEPGGGAQAREVTAAQDAANRIAVVGRQRMLSQQIVRNACFVMARINADHFAAMTEATVDQFDTALVGLKRGNADLGLREETNPTVLARLQEAEQLWATLGAAARQIAAGDAHPVPMQQMIRLNLDTNEVMQKALRDMKAEYADQSVPEELARTIDLFGTQRMLTQKASKEVCFLTLDIAGAGASGNVTETIARFDEGMTMLINGAPEQGIMTPPSRRVKRQVDRVETTWRRFKTLLQAFEENPDRPESDRAQLAFLSDQVLREIDLAAHMYSN